MAAINYSQVKRAIANAESIPALKKYANSLGVSLESLDTKNIAATATPSFQHVIETLKATGEVFRADANEQKMAEKSAADKAVVDAAVKKTASKVGDTPSGISTGVALDWLKKLALWGGVAIGSIMIIRIVWRFLIRK